MIGSAAADSSPDYEIIVNGKVKHKHLDARFGHDRFYFNRGYHTLFPARGGYVIESHRRQYLVERGDFFLRTAGMWVNAAAPVGAFVASLPPYFLTVWLGGLPYYYANDTFYVWSEDHLDYEIVKAPPGIDSHGSTLPPMSQVLYSYPSAAKTALETAADSENCRLQAKRQDSYTTQAAEVEAPLARRQLIRVLADETTCLRGLGYAVR